MPRTPESLRNLAVEAVVFLSAHRTAAEINDLARVWNDFQPQVFIPELAGWDATDVAAFHNVSNETMPVDAALYISGWYPEEPYYAMHKRRMEIVYGTHVDVKFMDLPRDHPLQADMMNSMPPYGAYRDRTTREVHHFFPERSFNEALDKWSSYLLDFIRTQKEREAYMLGRFQEIVTIFDIPHLRVLVQLGGAHKRLVHDIRDMGVQVTPVFGQKQSASYHSVALSLHRYDRQVNDLILARGLLSFMMRVTFLKDFDRICPDSRTQEKFVTQKMRKLSVSQCEDLYKTIVDGSSSISCAERIDRFFASQGLGDSMVREFIEEYA